MVSEQPMDTAPTDGTHVLIKRQVVHWVPERPGSPFNVHKPVGTQWIEGRFVDGAWREWCGTERTRSTGSFTPLAWAPLPC